MARRRSRSRLLVPGAANELDNFKADVMKKEGYNVNKEHPENVKFEVARTLGIPLQSGYNGNLKTEDAGRIGGKIGGSMVREMIRMAQQKLVEQRGGMR